MRRPSRLLTCVLALLLCAVATPVVSAGPFKVGAFYFGVFNAPSCVVCGSGNTDWWKGVRDYYNGDVDPPWQGQDFSYLKPALGFYDNSQTATLEKQIRQARANGLGFFNFYWYWRKTLAGGTGGEAYKDGLRTFLAARNTEDLEFAISVTAHPWDNLGIPTTHFTRAIDALIQNYLNKPHYLRTTDGRLVVFLLDTRGIGDGVNAGTATPVGAFISQLSQRVSQQLGKSVYVVINTELHNLDPLRPPMLDIKNLAGVHAYLSGTYYGASLDASSPVVGKLATYNSRITGLFAGFTDRPLIVSYLSDFNEKPRTRLGTPASQIRYLSDWTLSLMTSGLTQVKSYADGRNDGVVDNYVNLYAWNEWHEGGVNLEPSDRDGEQQLVQVAQVFGLATSGNSQCKKLGNCTQNPSAPTGTLDLANCSQIAGWARDADTSVPLQVHLYKDAPYGQGGTFVGSYPANVLRTDLPFRDQKHGFVISTPQALKTGLPVKVYAYGINVNWNGDPAGTNPILNLSPKTVTCSP
jgi:hypothetical protein